MIGLWFKKSSNSITTKTFEVGIFYRKLKGKNLECQNDTAIHWSAPVQQFWIDTVMKDVLKYSLRIYSDVITVSPLSIFFQILSAGVCFRISSREFWTEVIILWQYVYIWPQRHTPRICNKNSDYVIMAIRFLIYKKDLIHVLFLTFLVSGKSCVFSRCKVLVKRCQNPYGSMASFKYWYWQLKIHYFI